MHVRNAVEQGRLLVTTDKGEDVLEQQLGETMLAAYWAAVTVTE